MDNNNNNQRKSAKIIPFPGLKNRLYEEGIEQIKSEEYEKACELLREALAMDPFDDHVSYAILTAYVAAFDGQSYELVADLGEELLQKGIGDYFEVLDMYMSSLIQLKQHDKVVEYVNVLLTESDLTEEQEKHFQSLKSLSEKILLNKPSADIQSTQTSRTVDEFKIGDVQEHTIWIGHLKDKNIRPYLNLLKDLLSDEEIHPFLQTIALNVLREHEYNEEITVNKFGQTFKVYPSQVKEIEESSHFLQIVSILEDYLLDDNPTLFEQLFMMINRHFFIIYPLEMEEFDPHVIALVYYKIGYNFYGIDMDVHERCRQKNVDIDLFVRVYEWIMKIETESSFTNS